jgi:hypothetical protein
MHADGSWKQAYVSAKQDLLSALSREHMLCSPPAFSGLRSQRADQIADEMRRVEKLIHWAITHP